MQDDAGTDAPTSTAKGRPAAHLVPAAIKAKSAKYKMVGTITVGDGRTSSPAHVKNGGVVGGTQP